MANQLMIILWLCCFFLATYGAPFGDGGSPKRSIRARRVIRKAGHRKMGPGRNLVRYRYPIYAKRSSAADWNVDDGNEDFISFLSDQLNSDGTASDFSPLMKANELDMINNDDDKNSRIDFNLKKKKKMNDFNEKAEFMAFDDNDADDADNDVEDIFLGRVDALLSQLEGQKGMATEMKKYPGWMKQDRSSSPNSYMNFDTNKEASAPASFYDLQFHDDGIPIQKDPIQKNSAYSGRKKRSVGTSATPVEASTPSSAGGKQVAPSTAAVHSGNIRKKSIDWDDYFGYDKRSGGDADDAALEHRMQNYLENEFYRPMAQSLPKRAASKSPNATGLGAAAKKRRSFKGQSKFDRQWETETEAEGEEEAEEEEADDIDRRSRRLVANLINQLKEEDLKAATSKMTRELFDAIEEEVGADDRRKKSSLRKRSGPKLNSMKLDVASGNQCVVIEEVMVTCDSLGHLMGGYRSILSDACYRQQACSICVARDQELEPCDVEFQQYTSELCGDDVLCRSQSRRLHSALVKIGAVQDELFKGSMGRIEALCRHDVCLPAFLKRR